MNFTPKQKYTLLGKMGYTGPMREDMMEDFIASQPGVSAKMGKFQKALDNKIGMATGGSVPDPQEEIQKELDAQVKVDKALAKQATKGPQNVKGTSDRSGKISKLESKTAGAQKAVQATLDPESLVTKQEVEKVEETPGTVVDQDVGQVTGDVTAEATTVDQVEQAEQPDDITTTTYEADTTAADKIEQAGQEVGFAESEVGEKATVQGQYEELMKDFEDGTPPWASGAMREATARMQQRGLGASSMAGMAVVQAAMEAALPIAQQDAATFAQREMANLSNEQQSLILKSQFRYQGILSDQAAENAAKQFNASSENQTKQFVSELQSRVQQFNATQVNSVRMANADRQTAVSKFNTEIQNQREQFNAQNRQIIAQANAQWRQTIETTNTAEQNEANRQYAANTNALTAADLDNYWQEERDKMAFSFQRAENAKDRKFQTALAVYQGHLEDHLQRQSQDSGGFGSIVGTVLGSFAGKAGSAAGAAMFSDRRMKKEIRKIHTRSDGLNVYRYKYNWGHIDREGFMADEVRELYPEAVIEDEDGFLKVDYNKVPEEKELENV